MIGIKVYLRRIYSISCQQPTSHLPRQASLLHYSLTLLPSIFVIISLLRTILYMVRLIPIILYRRAQLPPPPSKHHKVRPLLHMHIINLSFSSTQFAPSLAASSPSSICVQLCHHSAAHFRKIFTLIAEVKKKYDNFKFIISCRNKRSYLILINHFYIDYICSIANS